MKVAHRGGTDKLRVLVEQLVGPLAPSSHQEQARSPQARSGLYCRYAWTKRSRYAFAAILISLSCNLPALGAGADKDDAALLEVMQRASSGDRRVRYQAAIEANEKVTPAHLPMLHRMVREHKVGRMRNMCIGLIGKLADPDSADVLIDVIQHDDSEWVRHGAIGQLRNFKTARAYDVLAKALTSDDSARVRKAAAVSLGLLPGAKAERALKDAVEPEQDKEVRTVIREALARRDQPKTRRAKVQPGEVTEGFLDGTRYLLYVPSQYKASEPAPLLISVHGTHGLPEGYMKICLEDAEHYGLVVIAPHFDYANFPDFGSLDPWPGDSRSDLRLLDIVDHVSRRLPIQAEKFYIFGHSQGGQFVHRFILAHSERILRAVAAAGGNWVPPDPNEVFPYGTARNPYAPDLGEIDFSKLVTAPMAVVIGTKDLERRLAAAAKFMADVRAYAKEHDLPMRIEYFEVPDGPHQGSRNYPTATKYLFADLSG